MAAGPLLARAIADLSELPEDAHERAVATQILLNMQHVFSEKPNPTPEEQEFMVATKDAWAMARENGREEGRNEGRKVGHAEGRTEEATRAVLTVLARAASSCPSRRVSASWPRRIRIGWSAGWSAPPSPLRSPT